MRWVNLSDCGDPLVWLDLHLLSPLAALLYTETRTLCQGPWGVRWAKDFTCHLEWTWTTLHALLSLQLLSSPCWGMSRGSPWSWIISDVCFCLREARAWLHQSISIFDSLIFLNLSASYCNWYQAERIIRLVTFDTVAVSATVQRKAQVLPTAWSLNSSVFFWELCLGRYILFGQCKWLDSPSNGHHTWALLARTMATT